MPFTKGNTDRDQRGEMEFLKIITFVSSKLPDTFYEKDHIAGSHHETVYDITPGHLLVTVRRTCSDVAYTVEIICLARQNQASTGNGLTRLKS